MSPVPQGVSNDPPRWELLECWHQGGAVGDWPSEHCALPGVRGVWCVGVSVDVYECKGVGVTEDSE